MSKNKLNRNAEQHLRTLELLGRTYPSHLLYESVNISNRCKFSLDEIYYSYPNEFIPKSYTKTSYLKDNLLRDKKTLASWTSKQDISTN